MRDKGSHRPTRSKAHLHVLRGAPEPHDADVPAAIHTAHECVQQEVENHAASNRWRRQLCALNRGGNMGRAVSTDLAQGQRPRVCRHRSACSLVRKFAQERRYSQCALPAESRRNGLQLCSEAFQRALGRGTHLLASCRPQRRSACSQLAASIHPLERYRSRFLVHRYQ